LGGALLVGISTRVAAECAVIDSACYPWRIESGKPDTVLWEILPNNTASVATYRICVCPPAEGVKLEFDFEQDRITLGTVELNGGGTVCRDYRIMSSRRSRLLLSRTSPGNKSIEGCYSTN
jgi:hypothetical protein